MTAFKRTILFCLFFSAFSSINSAEGPTVEDIQALENLKLGTDVVKDDEREFREIQTSTNKEIDQECDNCIFGYELFTTTPTTFSLSSNVSIPPNYTLGPGDKLTIELYGNENSTKEGYITRTGTLHVGPLGPITLAGLTFSEAKSLISKKVKNELIGTDVFITLSELRSINVYIVGAAYKPGTYTLSGLSNITNALFSSGGPNKSGSLRNIQLKRNGETIKEFDLYKLLLKGDTSDDARLQDGDAIFIPLINKTVRIEGSVPRPSIYELKEGEKLSDILGFAGFINLNGKIELSRVNLELNGREFTLFSSNNNEKISQLAQRGDTINVVNSSNLESRNVVISGEVLYPGNYGINAGDTLLTLINKAGGFRIGAYSAGAVFKREEVAKMQKEAYLKTADALDKSIINAVSSGIPIEGETYFALKQFVAELRAIEPTGRRVVEADLFLLKSDPRLNFTLNDGDSLYIPPRSSSVTVIGEVLNGASHIYDQNSNINDYIKLSGGLTEGADKTQIFIVLPNGQAIQLKKRLFGTNNSTLILPGSTIVVSRNPDPFNWLKLASVVTPVLSNLAVSAAAIAAIK